MKCEVCGVTIRDTVAPYVAYDHIEYGKRYEFCSIKCFWEWVDKKKNEKN